MTEQIEFSSELAVRSEPVYIQCYKLHDRTGHSVFVAANGRQLEILRSVEGDDTQEFPPSGAIQEMVLEDASVGKLPVLMGLGSAGKSTWSCSIEADATIAAIAFDFACKTRATQWLGSSYRIMDEIDCERISDNIVRLKIGDDLAISVRSFGDANLTLDPVGRTLAIQAPSVESGSSAQRAQRRWRYVVGLASSLEFASDR